MLALVLLAMSATDMADLNRYGNDWLRGIGNVPAQCLIEVTVAGGQDKSVLTDPAKRDLAREKARQLAGVIRLHERATVTMESAGAEYQAQQKDLHDAGLISAAEFDKTVAENRQAHADAIRFYKETQRDFPSCKFLSPYSSSKWVRETLEKGKGQ